MKTAIQRLSDAEERALIEVACANGLRREGLCCHMTRQQGSGRGRHPEKGGFSILSGQEFDISYNLMLCEFCGNLEPFEVCPAKVLKIKEKLLGEAFKDAALYGDPGEGIMVRGRAESDTAHKKTEMPDFDDRPWDGPYDDE